MPMWKRMNEKIMEKVLDFLEDKKHTVVIHGGDQAAGRQSEKSH